MRIPQKENESLHQDNPAASPTRCTALAIVSLPAPFALNQIQPEAHDLRSLCTERSGGLIHSSGNGLPLLPSKPPPLDTEHARMHSATHDRI